MPDTSDIPRYSLRKRPAGDVPFHQKAKQSRTSLPPPDAPSGVPRPTTPESDIKQVTASTQTSMNAPTPCQEQLAPKPSVNDKNNNNTTTTDISPHQLTINGRTFTGPLPPNKTRDPSGNAATIPGDHNSHKLFVCADCPISQQENKHDNLHALCYPSHPCLWSFPPKAREAFANRRHWLALDKPLEATRRPNGRLPRLLDEDGEPVTRGLRVVRKGEDVNRAYDEVVMRRYLAVVRDDECCEVRGAEEGSRRREEYRFAHQVGREAMLGDMGWGFEW